MSRKQNRVISWKPSSDVGPEKKSGSSDVEPVVSVWTVEPKPGDKPLRITQVSSGFPRTKAGYQKPTMGLAA
ncbi:hypothetical protein [Paludifilum halophilum]|uniref:Uncharacterized protein n=1 Tax=Paludifilum halophilum TaxID=1642702 RepID=A0A235B9F1_9BACL|nr:hypothetical protein [Paludifilum halophilum]OYD08852.1 hypothetical protein CHM34_03430 [Paludifilum halophilum]